jgi:hypothetical protein
VCAGYLESGGDQNLDPAQPYPFAFRLLPHQISPPPPKEYGITFKLIIENNDAAFNILSSVVDHLAGYGSVPGAGKTDPDSKEDGKKGTIFEENCNYVNKLPFFWNMVHYSFFEK